MDTFPGLHEHISALADGELPAAELELAFAALDTDTGRQAWRAYGLIGEVLRAGQGAGALSAGFGAALASRLAAEAAITADDLRPVVLAPLATPGTAEPLAAGPLPQP